MTKGCRFKHFREQHNSVDGQIHDKEVWSTVGKLVECQTHDQEGIVKKL